MRYSSRRTTCMRVRADVGDRCNTDAHDVIAPARCTLCARPSLGSLTPEILAKQPGSTETFRRVAFLFPSPLPFSPPLPRVPAP